jgi:hypothetical protein
MKERAEARAKIRMILEAINGPAKVSDIITHPVAAGGLSSITASMFLRHMEDVAFNKKNRTWSIQKEKEKIDTKRRGPYKKKKSEKEPTLFDSARFIIKANGDLYLCIGDTSLPVGFE